MLTSIALPAPGKVSIKTGHTAAYNHSILLFFNLISSSLLRFHSSPRPSASLRATTTRRCACNDSFRSLGASCLPRLYRSLTGISRSCSLSSAVAFPVCVKALYAPPDLLLFPLQLPKPGALCFTIAPSFDHVLSSKRDNGVTLVHHLVLSNVEDRIVIVIILSRMPPLILNRRSSEE